MASAGQPEEFYLELAVEPSTSARSDARHNDVHAEQSHKTGVLSTVLVYAKKYNLIIAFIVAITAGLLAPSVGATLGKKHNGIKPFTVTCVIIIMFLGGIKLKPRDISDAAQEWKGLIFGATSILFFTVLIGIGIVRGAADIDAIPDDQFATGLMIFFATPTTLNMGVVISTQAGGNAAVALLLTVICNMTGVFTVPGMLVWVGGLGGADGLSAGTLVLKLVYSVFFPSLIGHLLRRNFKLVERFADRRKFYLSLTANILVSCIPWVSISEAQNNNELDDLTAVDAFAVIGWFIVIHTTLILFNTIGVKVLKLSRATSTSVLIMASQKTFPVVEFANGTMIMP